ncbi:hypothetical protein PIB30_060618 [Stylosanthes scabra]|uniref:Uncharacterized protein n=1 Tax=Stylosanthes scabra TaxID=79078 RepID=A0ABU6WNX9_9FABA|nr:hypothetical protein [Stylosanthes scabra]
MVMKDPQLLGFRIKGHNRAYDVVLIRPTPHSIPTWHRYATEALFIARWARLVTVLWAKPMSGSNCLLFETVRDLTLGIEKYLGKAKKGIGSKGFMKRSQNKGSCPGYVAPRPSLFEAQFDLYGGRTAEAQCILTH